MANRDSRSLQARVRIADLAARFIAEHGIQDYGLAKRKAARQLGLPEGHGLPSNEEVDAALMQRQDLFDPEEQAANLHALREQALAVMREFEKFQPILTGAVASGAISAHSRVELEITADSSKDFEQFLVNRAIEYKTQDRGGRMAYLIFAQPADVLVRMQASELHRGQSGSRQRLTLPQLEKLAAVDG